MRNLRSAPRLGDHSLCCRLDGTIRSGSARPRRYPFDVLPDFTRFVKQRWDVGHSTNPLDRPVRHEWTGSPAAHQVVDGPVPSARWLPTVTRSPTRGTE